MNKQEAKFIERYQDPDPEPKMKRPRRISKKPPTLHNIRMANREWFKHYEVYNDVSFLTLEVNDSYILCLN
jgi:hypothetical protein